ncbi:hypothetical protein FA95DRAFT_1553650 [Auriscalpium vulgare]|uniref:Uncharacterized protein n=1 Tax=Auriscalpium vulgare TaxID=40419 RepID=A0ACB8S8S5_9AGAM|nr:hypothetical protein FA95DRAFT_1553650 [Auriscalpium vulgare]
MMIHAGRADGLIPCQRTGCGDVLKSVRALTYHLHIHDVHDRASAPRSFVCAQCAGSYESPRELSMHDCERHRSVVSIAPSASGPIKHRFRRMIHSWSCLSDSTNV